MKRHFTILALAIVALVACGRPAWSQGPMPPPGYGPPAGYGPPGGFGPPPGFSPAPPPGYGYAPPMGFDGRPVGYMQPGEGMPPTGIAPGGIPPEGMLKPIPGEGPTMGPDAYMPGGDGYCAPGADGAGFGCAHKSVWGWFEGEALSWYQQGKHVPALVTTSPNGTPQTDAGVLGLPTTTILLGNEQLGGGVTSQGYRLTLGAWLDRGLEQALVVRYWSLDGVDTFNEFQSDAAGDPILARPFLNVGLDPDQQDALLVGYPGVSGPGFIRVRTSGNMLGGDVLYRAALDRGCGYRLDFVGGYQGAKINDNLTVRHFLTDQDPGNLIPDGTTIDGTDFFGASNEFHGGVIGFQGEFQRGPWLLRCLTKLGIGNMHQRVNIDGFTTVDTGAGTATSPGALLTQPTNIGQYSRNEICFVPEINLTLSYQITCHIDINIGYSFIYYSSVANAADQIDTGVNLNNPIVDEFRPNLAGIADSDFYAQGVNIGFLVHW